MSLDKSVLNDNACLTNERPHMSSNDSMRFVDLFAGLGGFHVALRRLGHRCVFACDVNPQLQEVYSKNFGIRPAGDLRQIDVTRYSKTRHTLCWFSLPTVLEGRRTVGHKVQLWGDLFSRHVLRIVRAHRPRYFLFENVANLERHDGGRTWKRMRRALVDDCGYDIRTRVLSPHKYGIPQIRDRLFIVGCLHGLDFVSMAI